MKTKQIRFVEAVKIEARLRDRASMRHWAPYAVRLAQEINPDTIPSDAEGAAKRIIGLLYRSPILPRF
jgi:hypothetical protein